MGSDLYFFQQVDTHKVPRRYRKLPEELPESLRFAHLNPKVAALLASKERSQRPDNEDPFGDGLGKKSLLPDINQAFTTVRNQFDSALSNDEDSQRYLFEEAKMSAPAILEQLSRIIYYYEDLYKHIPKSLEYQLLATWSDLTSDITIVPREWQTQDMKEQYVAKQQQQDGNSEEDVSDNDMLTGRSRSRMGTSDRSTSELGGKMNVKRAKPRLGVIDGAEEGDGMLKPDSRMGHRSGSRASAAGSIRQHLDIGNMSRVGSRRKGSKMSFYPGMTRGTTALANPLSYMQTINFQLSNKTFEEKGWVMLKGRQEEIDQNEILEYCVTRMQESMKQIAAQRQKDLEQGHDNPVVVRYYGDTKKETLLKYRKSPVKSPPNTVYKGGKPRIPSIIDERNEGKKLMQASHIDGSTIVYYPSGRPAIIHSAAGFGRPGYYTIVYEDGLDSKMLACFTPCGKGVCYHENGVVRFLTTDKGGHISETNGKLVRKWKWPQASVKITEPLSFQISSNVMFRCVSQGQMTVVFSSQKEMARFNVGPIPDAEDYKFIDEADQLLTSSTFSSRAAKDLMRIFAPTKKSKRKGRKESDDAVTADSTSTISLTDLEVAADIIEIKTDKPATTSTTTKPKLDTSATTTEAKADAFAKTKDETDEQEKKDWEESIKSIFAKTASEKPNVARPRRKSMVPTTNSDLVPSIKTRAAISLDDTLQKWLRKHQYTLEDEGEEEEGDSEDHGNKDDANDEEDDNIDADVRDQHMQKSKSSRFASPEFSKRQTSKLLSPGKSHSSCKSTGMKSSSKTAEFSKQQTSKLLSPGKSHSNCKSTGMKSSSKTVVLPGTSTGRRSSSASRSRRNLDEDTTKRAKSAKSLTSIDSKDNLVTKRKSSKDLHPAAQAVLDRLEAAKARSGPSPRSQCTLLSDRDTDSRFPDPNSAREGTYLNSSSRQSSMKKKSGHSGEAMKRAKYASGFGQRNSQTSEERHSKSASSDKKKSKASVDRRKAAIEDDHGEGVSQQELPLKPQKRLVDQKSAGNKTSRSRAMLSKEEEEIDSDSDERIRRIAAKEKTCVMKFRKEVLKKRGVICSDGSSSDSDGSDLQTSKSQASEIIKLMEDFPDKVTYDIEADKELGKLQRKAKNLVEDWMEHYRLAIGLASPFLQNVRETPNYSIANRHAKSARLSDHQQLIRKAILGVEDEQTLSKARIPSAPLGPPGDDEHGRKTALDHRLANVVKFDDQEDVGDGMMSPSATAMINRLAETASRHSNCSKTSSAHSLSPSRQQPPDPRATSASATSSRSHCPLVIRQYKLGYERPQCRCSRHHIPFIMDLELDEFVATETPEGQLVVIMIVSSLKAWKGMKEVHYTMYLNKFGVPYRKVFPGITKAEEMLNELYANQNRNRTRPCVQSRSDMFRVFKYDINTAAEMSDHTQPLLLTRHNVVPGMFLIYCDGRLLFCDHIFNGYGNTRKDFKKQVMKSRHDHIQGFSLPRDFKFSPSQGRSGMRSAWGGEIGGAGVDKYSSTGTVIDMSLQPIHRPISSSTDSGITKEVHIDTVKLEQATRAISMTLCTTGFQPLPPGLQPSTLSKSTSFATSLSDATIFNQTISS